MNVPIVAALTLAAAGGAVVVLAAAAPEPHAETATEGAPTAAQALAVPAAATLTADDDRARHLDQLRPLSCFGCHSLAVYWDGRPPPADPATAQTAIAATATADGAADTAESDEQAAEEADEELPDPKKFAHGLHRAEGVGHCHQCHTLTAHAQVTVRLDACRECH